MMGGGEHHRKIAQVYSALWHLLLIPKKPWPWDIRDSLAAQGSWVTSLRKQKLGREATAELMVATGYLLGQPEIIF